MEIRELESDLKTLVVESLGLQDVQPHELDSRAALVGDESTSLGLDSIDFLEIAVAIHRRWGIRIRADEAQSHRVFESIGSLAEHLHGKLDASRPVA